MLLYSSLVRHQLQDECSWKHVQGSRGIPERLLQRNGGCSFLSYREKIRQHFSHIYKANNVFNWFRLDSDGAHKVHKCTSNISLYC